jgi:hypothetical protein
MKYLLRIVCAALLASTALPSSALGQKTFALGVGGGAAIPVGKLSNTQDTGYNGIIALAMGVAELPIGIRIDGIYNTLLNNKQLAPGGGNFSSDLRVMGVLANLIFAFSGTNAKPYVVVGGGLYNTKPDTTAAKSENYFGVNAGLGATFGIGPFATFVESRYHSISRKAAKGGVMQFVPITVGLMF